MLSRNLINPALNGPLVQGVQRTEYTIGVSGCGKKAVYISVRAVGAVGCTAIEGRSPGAWASWFRTCHFGCRIIPTDWFCYANS